MKKLMVDNKGKQQIQEEEEFFLYKPYDIDLPKPKTPELTFIQDEIKNLDKYIKYMQSSIKIMLFYPQLYYKFIQLQGE